MTAPKKRSKAAPKRTKPESSEHAWVAMATHQTTLLHHAAEVDAQVADLHAVELALSGPFIVDAKKCRELLEEVVGALRWQTARMRIDAFGLIVEPEGP